MKRLAVIASVALALMPLSVHATYRTVLGQAASNAACNYPQAVDGLQLASSGASYVVPADGHIKAWSFWTEWNAAVSLEVWRPTASPDTYRLVGITRTRHVLAGSATNQFYLSPAHYLPVKAGDRLGMHMATSTSQISCALYTQNPADQYVWIYDASKPRLGTVAYFNPAGANMAQLNAAAVVIA